MSMISFRFYNNMKLIRLQFITCSYLYQSYTLTIDSLHSLQLYAQNINKMQKTEQVSQPISQHDDEDLNQITQEQKVVPTWSVIIMIGYLYFVQGILLAVSGTTPYIYPELPDYFTLSLFSLAPIPFSVKFLLAPVLERYSFLSYGKRKTWIVISQMGTAAMIILGSFFTDQHQAKIFAILCIFMYLFNSLQDISLDALCLKELGNPKLMSTLQAACQSSGNIIGGLVLLKATSMQFASSIGLAKPITDFQTLLLCFAGVLFIPSLIIHFKFKERSIQADQKIVQTSICQVYSIYKYFFKPQYRYFRTLAFFMLYNQGFNFFLAGYNYELIKHGFSRNLINTVDNIQNIVITGLVFLFGTKVNFFGLKKTFMLELSLALAMSAYLLIFFPISPVPVIIGNVVLGLLLQWDFLLTTELCSYFPECGTTGMIFTMNASAANLGKNTFVHTAILKKLAWRPVAFFGLAIQVPLIFIYLPKMMDLIDEGETRIELETNENEEKQPSEPAKLEGEK